MKATSTYWVVFSNLVTPINISEKFESTPNALLMFPFVRVTFKMIEIKQFQETNLTCFNLIRNWLWLFLQAYVEKTLILLVFHFLNVINYLINR